VHQRSVFPQSVIGAESRRQLLIIAINEADGLFSDVFVDGGNRGDDIANITHLFTCENLLVLDRETESLARHIISRQDCRDAR